MNYGTLLNIYCYALGRDYPVIDKLFPCKRADNDKVLMCFESFTQVRRFESLKTIQFEFLGWP